MVAEFNVPAIPLSSVPEISLYFKTKRVSLDSEYSGIWSNVKSIDLTMNKRR